MSVTPKSNTVYQHGNTQELTFDISVIFGENETKFEEKRCYNSVMHNKTNNQNERSKQRNKQSKT